MGKFFVGSAMGLMMGGARKFQRTMTKEVGKMKRQLRKM